MAAPPGAERAQEVLDRLGTVVLGQHDMLRQMMVALLAGGHALLEGVPGTAKTLAIRSLSLALDLRFGRVQFTPDLMPTDLVGVNVLDELKKEFVYHPGPIFTDLLLADEINRAPAKTQAALLEAMQERQVTVDGKTRPLPVGFTVFASQNPVEYEGTYPLPEAQLDRFLIKIDIQYPPADAERAILDRYAQGFSADRAESYGVQPVLTAAELAGLRQAVARVHVEPVVRDYITHIVRSTREELVAIQEAVEGVTVDPDIGRYCVALAAATRAHHQTLVGSSPRGGLALMLVARAYAVVAGRDYVVPEDVKAVAVPALAHRITIRPELWMTDVSGRSVVETVLGQVPAPAARERVADP
ncbi:MAG TPA: MoxR family ATPase [Longimicrobium sp.]|nr:MoxR family ATPase [Longimicrobium sp.]